MLSNNAVGNVQINPTRNENKLKIERDEKDD
jgi:hypothetical protein